MTDTSPHHGWVWLAGKCLPVHAHTFDYHRTDTAYQRFNKRAALAITNVVGTMTCAWLFCVLALLSLPAVLSAFSAFHGVFPNWMIRASIIALIAWIAQTFFQLVLLPTIIVGQNLQNAAAEARSAKTFADVEEVRDSLNLHTAGGIEFLYTCLKALADAGKVELPDIPAQITEAAGDQAMR